MISDRKGRKPVIIASNICMGLSTLMFGFSVNYSMAVAARFLMGFSNGKFLMVNLMAILLATPSLSLLPDPKPMSFPASLLVAILAKKLVWSPIL